MNGPEEYDEVLALMDYLRFQQSILTDAERAAEQAFLGRAKADGAVSRGDQAMARLILQKWGHVGDAQVEALISDGVESFWERICNRVSTAEQSGEIKLNRCPECKRIVRTALAKQCLWCGHDWH